MHWQQRLEGYTRRNASRVLQATWLAFAALAVGLAIPGIPRYFALLQTPCDGARCFAAQVTAEAVATANLRDYAFVQALTVLVIAIPVAGTAAFLIWWKVAQRAAVLAAFVATALATGTFSQALAYDDARFRFPAQLVLFVQFAGLPPLLCLLPDGEFRPRAVRRAALAYALASLLYLVPGVRGWLAPGTTGQILWLVALAFVALVVLAVLIARFRGAVDNAQREQLRWVLVGIGLAAPVALTDTSLGLVRASPFQMTIFAATPLTQFTLLFFAIGSGTCLLVALVNYEPLDAEIFVNRALVYGALTASTVGLYGAVVGYLGTVFHSDNALISLVATGLVAVLFQPLRDRLQRGINRLMYGERDEPYRVLSRLGQRLESAIAPEQALPLTVETVARALKLPFVAVELRRDGRSLPIASYGAAREDAARFPLVYAGETIGDLVAAGRGSHEPLSPADRQLLGDLARQLGVAAYATLITGELDRARLRIVAAQEETRRRLGSDLHDGLGHQLTALARRAELTTRMLPGDADDARAALVDITRQLNAAVAQVRGLAHQLHPPELELLGLVEALRERAQLLPGLAIHLDAPADLPRLHPAVETAAYYIALEALTNIEKHAGARSCCLRLALTPGDAMLRPPLLELEIADDGRGPSAEQGAIGERGIGLGMLSMQARAVEVGGSCRVEAAPDGGTRILVRIPVEEV